MEPEINQEQKEQLNTWASQRDALLLEISSLRTEKERLEATNKEVALSSSDLDIRINQSLGRLLELSNYERDQKKVVDIELSKSLIEKGRLETEVMALRHSINNLVPQKQALENDILFLTNTFNMINDRVGILDKVVDHVVRVSNENKFAIEELFTKIKAGAEEIINLNKKNVDATNIVLEKVPSMLIELQKEKLVRYKI